MSSMRAIVMASHGPPEVLQMQQLPLPSPGPGQLRIRVAFAGMNPLDAVVRRQPLDWLPIKLPFTPGIEHTGIVDAVGPAVDAQWIGRRVLSRLGFGGYAEYSLAAVAGLLAVPQGMSLRDGCVYRGCTYTAWHALHKVGRLRAGERVLVHSAAGAVGCMAMQIARDAGCQAVGLCGGPDKAAWLRAFGCDEVVDYLCADWPQQALQLTAGRGFDVILDGNGGPNAAHNIDLAARLGRVVYIGATADADPAPIPVATLILKSIAVAGMSLRQVEEPPGSAADQEIVAAILNGRWKLPISEVVPLAAVADLHRRLEARQLRGRAVIEVGGEL
jgi:NADPH2:quinone reductase